MTNVTENYTLVPTVHGFVRKNHLLVCENYAKTFVTVIMKHPVSVKENLARHLARPWSFGLASSKLTLAIFRRPLLRYGLGFIRTDRLTKMGQRLGGCGVFQVFVAVLVTPCSEHIRRDRIW